MLYPAELRHIAWRLESFDPGGPRFALERWLLARNEQMDSKSRTGAAKVGTTDGHLQPKLDMMRHLRSSDRHREGSQDVNKCQLCRAFATLRHPEAVSRPPGIWLGMLRINGSEVAQLRKSPLDYGPKVSK